MSLRPHLRGADAAAVQHALTDALGTIATLAIVALVVLAVSGGLRLAYWRANTPSGDFVAKRKMLVIKHVAFALLYGVGTWWLLSIAR